MTEGTSIALIGSSGVGKSTLINAMFHTELATREIREDDARGKHTTTHRALFFCNNGVSIIDTPGMRELQLYDAEQGIERVFGSILELSQQCRYTDCSHVNESGCAIQAAIADQTISQAHFDNYRNSFCSNIVLQNGRMLDSDYYCKRTSKMRPLFSWKRIRERFIRCE